jgi:hypothetical protein
MGTLAFCCLERNRSDMCGLRIHYNKHSLSGGDLEFTADYIGLIPMKRMYIVILVGAGLDNMTKSSSI